MPEGAHYTGKTGKMAKRNQLSGKVQEILEICQSIGNFVCSTCKFANSKDQGYCMVIFATQTTGHKSQTIVQEQVSVIREKRQNTSNFKIDFEWGPY